MHQNLCSGKVGLLGLYVIGIELEGAPNTAVRDLIVFHMVETMWIINAIGSAIFGVACYAEIVVLLDDFLWHGKLAILQ